LKVDGRKQANHMFQQLVIKFNSNDMIGTKK